MKNSIFIILFSLALITASSSCSNSAPKSTTIESKVNEQIVYTCTMHPEIRRDKPGKCPKCGMELVMMEPTDNTHMNNDSNNMHRH